LQEGIKKRHYREKVHEKYSKDEQLMNKTLKDLKMKKKLILPLDPKSHDLVTFYWVT
jgi:hypothetical protein